MSEAHEVPIQEVSASTPKAPSPAVALNTSPEVGIEQPKNKVDLLMVFGQGPVKPLLRDSDLDPEMKSRWEAFKVDPLHSEEPDFRVIEGEAWTKQLAGLTEEQVQEKIAQWQGQGRFGLNRWGRENALAAGFTLVCGYSEKALLSGGKTIPGWAKDKLPPGRLEKWPSEAQLMKDIIVRRFGKMYQEKYGRSIDEALILEDSSTNTLENLANSLNQNPELLDDPTKLGLLATDFHIDRSERIAALFTPGKEASRTDGAQDVLMSRLEGRVTEEKNKATYREILNWMTDPANPDLVKRQGQEARWTSGLVEPQFINYWLGYIGLVKDPVVLQNTVERFREDPAWIDAARVAFGTAGLSFDQLPTDLRAIPKEEFASIAEKLTVLASQENRVMPPPVTSG